MFEIKRADTYYGHDLFQSPGRGMQDTLHVLIVDDSADDALLLTRELKKNGFVVEVRHADSRESLRAALEEMDQLDITFCDYTIPGLSFEEANEMLRGVDEYAPLILVTGTISEDMATDALRGGVQDFLIKGRFTRLATIVEREMRDARARQLHHQAENKIARLANMLNKAQAAIVAINLDRTITFWNAGAERLYGWKEEEVLYGNIDSLLFSNAAEAHAQAMRETTIHGEWQGELVQYNREGRPITLRCTWTTVDDEIGEVEGILMTCIDVSDQKQWEEMFRRAQRVQTMGMLASGMAHDLNNLLSPILLAGSLLKSKTTDPTNVRVLNTIEQCVYRATHLIKQALHFTRGDGQDKQIVKLRYLLNEFEQLIRGTFPKSIDISLDVEKKLPPLFCNVTQIEQIMMNLCINARDAMLDGGKLSISARQVQYTGEGIPVLAEHDPGVFVAIEVSDDGAGISPEDLDKVFDPFFSTKSEDQGSGLGLYTVSNIVKEYLGEIDVVSAPGKGTTFTVYLPAYSDSSSQESSEVDNDELQGNREVLLIIDDDKDFLAVCKQAVEAFGYVVMCASDGPEAIATFADYKNSIDVVVCNREMPNLDGVSIIRAVRSLSPSIPVIMINASEDANEVKLAGLNVGNILMKPFSTSQLLKMVRKVISKYVV